MLIAGGIRGAKYVGDKALNYARWAAKQRTKFNRSSKVASNRKSSRTNRSGHMAGHLYRKGDISTYRKTLKNRPKTKLLKKMSPVQTLTWNGMSFIDDGGDA